MSNELKPCPFAKPGEEHHTEIVTAMGESWAACACGATGPMFSGVDSERKATEAWNTRAERTCHPVRRHGKSFSEEEKKTTLDACCSECRGFLGEAWEIFECDRDLFCSGCGAKVVE